MAASSAPTVDEQIETDAIHSVPELKTEILNLSTQIQGEVSQKISITSDEQFIAAGTRIGKLRGYRAEIVKMFAEPKDKAYKAHKSICALESKMLAKVDPEINAIDAELVRYNDEKLRIANEEAKRIEQEKQAVAERERQAEIERAKKAGDKAQVRALKSAPLPVASVARSAAAPVVAGLGFTKEKFVASVDEPEVFLAAMMKPAIYLYMAEAFEKKAKEPKNAKDRSSIQRCADFLRRSAVMLPRIPYTAVEIKENVISRVANDNNGKLDWPGVKIETSKKTRSK